MTMDMIDQRVRSLQRERKRERSRRGKRCLDPTSHVRNVFKACVFIQSDDTTESIGSPSDLERKEDERGAQGNTERRCASSWNEYLASGEKKIIKEENINLFKVLALLALQSSFLKNSFCHIEPTRRNDILHPRGPMRSADLR